MSTSETRIRIAGFTCPGCDCGTCVRETVREIEGLPGVTLVRLDRRSTQIVVRYRAVDGSPDRFRDIVSRRGIEIRN